MSLDQEALEILMGRQLDGEISSAEARLLQDHLQQDPNTRQLLDQLQDLHVQSQEAVTETVQSQGCSALDIIESAIHQTERPARLHWVKKCLGPQFAAGLAAGLLISAGALLLFGPKTSQTPPVHTSQRPVTSSPVLNTDPPLDYGDWPTQTPHVQRNVDWIMFTDPQGERYLIEGLREARRVRPAVYQGDF